MPITQISAGPVRRLKTVHVLLVKTASTVSTVRKMAVPVAFVNNPDFVCSDGNNCRINRFQIWRECD